jgi:hypothetical protein
MLNCASKTKAALNGRHGQARWAAMAARLGFPGDSYASKPTDRRAVMYKQVSLGAVPDRRGRHGRRQPRCRSTRLYINMYV